jgi:hypothetical protein
MVKTAWGVSISAVWTVMAWDDRPMSFLLIHGLREDDESEVGIEDSHQDVEGKVRVGYCYQADEGDE